MIERSGILAGAVATITALFVFSNGLASAASSYGPIDSDRMSSHVRILASDKFDGRAPGTVGERRTLRYLIEQFHALGLQPGGPRGGWTQQLTLVRLSHDGPVSAILKSPSDTETLRHGEQLVVNSTKESGTVDLKSAQLVFGGYGIHAPEVAWDDFAGTNLEGKIAIILRGEPDCGPFQGADVSKYGTTSAKLARLAELRAAGVLLITPGGNESWETRSNSALADQYAMDGEKADLSFTGSLNPAWARHLIESAGLDYGDLIKRASAASFHAEALPGVTLDLKFKMRRERVITHNVLARIPGAKRPAETVMFTAHWDHLGRGSPDASGDDIYNGAIDNAAGVAGLLELARAFAGSPRPDRSVVFLATTAEELGLWGAKEYMRNPVYPLETTVAVLNMDVLSMIGPTERAQIIGYGKTTLDTKQVPDAVSKQGRVLDTTKGFGGSLYNRSDHIIFARNGGVPVLYLGWGTDVIDPRPNPDTQYMETRYHTPKDEWWPGIDLRGAAQTVGLLYLVGTELANSMDWPEWVPGTESYNLRRKSASLRRRRPDEQK